MLKAKLWQENSRMILSLLLFFFNGFERTFNCIRKLCGVMFKTWNNKAIQVCSPVFTFMSRLSIFRQLNRPVYGLWFWAWRNFGEARLRTQKFIKWTWVITHSVWVFPNCKPTEAWLPQTTEQERNKLKMFSLIWLQLLFLTIMA